MDTINITSTRQNLFQLDSDVNVGFNPVATVNNKDKNVVLISKDERKEIEDTLYLSSIPELVDDINNIRRNEDWDKTRIFNSDEEW